MPPHLFILSIVNLDPFVFIKHIISGCTFLKVYMDDTLLKGI